MALARPARQPIPGPPNPPAHGLELTDLGPMRVTRRQLLLDLGMTDRAFGWPLEMVLKAGHAAGASTNCP